MSRKIHRGLFLSFGICDAASTSCPPLQLVFYYFLNVALVAAEGVDRINNAVSCEIVASGGVGNLKDIIDLYNLNLYGAIIGKAIYAGAIDLRMALTEARRMSERKTASEVDINRYLSLIHI